MLKIRLIDGSNFFIRNLNSKTGSGEPIYDCYKDVLTQSKKYDFTIVAWEGFNSLKFRKEVYPEYKMNRKKNPNADTIYESVNILKKVLENSGVFSVEVPNFEGDDVIATLVNKYKNVAEIFIDSNDADFTQLGVKTLANLPQGVSGPEDIRIYKTLVGDPSDNIKGIPNFGPVKFMKLTSSEKRELEMCFETQNFEIFQKYNADKDLFEQLCKYWQIVGFIPIPEDLLDEYIKEPYSDPLLVERIFIKYFINFKEEGSNEW